MVYKSVVIAKQTKLGGIIVDKDFLPFVQCLATGIAYLSKGPPFDSTYIAVDIKVSSSENSVGPKNWNLNYLNITKTRVTKT